MVKLIFYKYSNIRMECDDSDSVACCKSQEYLKSINNMVVRNKLNEHNGNSDFSDHFPKAIEKFSRSPQPSFTVSPTPR